MDVKIRSIFCTDCLYIHKGRSGSFILKMIQYPAAGCSYPFRESAVFSKKDACPACAGMNAAAHPLCELCLEKGIYTKTEEIHHKLPLSEGGKHDRANLIALCKPCHARIHAERGDRWHNNKAVCD